MIWRLGIEHARKQTRRSTLGLGWIFFKDIIYFATYTLFRYFMSGSRDVMGMNFVVYLITGIVAWQFLHEVITSGANALKRNKSVIKAIDFPITIIPTFEVLAIFLKRLPTFLLPFPVLYLMQGNFHGFNILLLFYYAFAMVFFSVAWTQIFSPFVALSDDFNQFYVALVRMAFFSVPVIWSFETIARGSTLGRIIRSNPMVYIIEGFRASYSTGDLPTARYTAYFWLACLLMLALGGLIQTRLYKFYSDFI